MAEYIEREAVLKKMQNWNTKERLINCVEDAPAAEVAPVVHAEWIYHDDDNTCSACGKEVTEHDDCGRKQWFTFCPHCGAKMDKNKPGAQGQGQKGQLCIRTSTT